MPTEQETGHYPRIWQQFKNTPWAITPEKLEEITAFLRLKCEGQDLPPFVAADKPRAALGPGIAVLPLFGLISQRADMLTEYSGGTSTERFTQAFRQAMADDDVGSIVFNVDSPGGGVFGVPELASEILAARGKKRIIAVANSFAASAAYWIASAAGEIAVTPSGQVGSIGVYAVHEDYSKMDEMIGLKTTIIKAGKYKAEVNETEPLTPEAQDYMQSEVDRYYGMFTAAVARGRGVKQADVENGFGEGRMVGAEKAVKLGMADRVATFDETLRMLMREREKPAAAKAESSPPSPTAGLDDERRRRRLRFA